MKLQFFSIPAKCPEQAQQTLNVFCAQHRVMTLEKQFVDAGFESYWSICVTYMDGINPPVAPGVANRRDRIDYSMFFWSFHYTWNRPDRFYKPVRSHSGLFIPSKVYSFFLMLP